MGDRSGQQLGNYRLIHLLGQGGFAEVYLAEHIYLKTRIAVKVLHADLAQHEFAGFLQEAQTIARLKHPHIIPIFDFGVDATPYLVMEYLPNGSLRQRHLRGSTVPLPTIVSYVNQIAAALQHAHDSKVIHRDVKPENMLINGTNEIVLSDFGIAATAHRTASLKTVNASGTPAYMAPEHIAGKPRPASDQYSLAIVVYEWLCGMPPFYGEPMSVMYQQTYAPVPSLCQQSVVSLSSVELIVQKALAKDPLHRFESVQDFASSLDLQAFVDLVKQEYSYHIAVELKGNTLSPYQAQQEARDFLALGPFEDKGTLLEGLQTLGKKYKRAERVYLDAANGQEEVWRQVNELAEKYNGSKKLSEREAQ